MKPIGAVLVACTMLVAFALPSARAQTSASVGKLKICKQNTPEDYNDPAWWRKEVVVPAGVEFRDVGPVGDASGEWIRLKIVTTQSVSLVGDQKCATVRAMIPSGQTILELGRKPVGQIVLSIGKDAGRLLEIMGLGNAARPVDKLAPWADVVTVAATIEEDFK